MRRCHWMPSLICVTALLISAQPAVAQPVKTDFRDPHKHLVLDPRAVASVEGLRLVSGAVEKDTHNPLFQADRPWENALNNLYPNVAYDDRDGCFKLWYKCVLSDKDVIAKMMPPKTVHDVGWFLCYATSKDGVVWEKPELDLVGFDNSTRNNVVARDVANVGVFLDKHDADAKRRYKMVYDVGPGNMRVRFSADGIRWSDEVTPEGLGKVGDTHNNAFWDEARGKYVLITKKFLGERLVYRSEGADFLKWSEPTLALRSTDEEGKQVQTYCMPAFPYGSSYLGWVMMYNVAAGRTVDCELVWSADTVTWRRVFPGKPLIPRGPKDSYDSACIYAQAGPPALKDGKLLVFYGGSATPHAGWKRHCLPCLARLRPDGFAGYAPAEEGKKGVLLTPPLRCTGAPLRISADAKAGSVRVAVVDEDGFGLDDCVAVAADVTDGEVRWKGGKSLAMLKGKAVRLRFELSAATLFAFSGVELLGKVP